MKKTGYDYIDDFLIEKFINQGISVSMYKNYMSVFKLLLDYNKIIPSDLNTYTTRNFKRLLGDNFIARNWGSASYNKVYKCLRCYCGYLVSEELLKENPFSKIKKRKEAKQLPKTLSKENVKELLNSLKTSFEVETFLGLRNITIVYTYLYTGLRLSELTNLKIDNINLLEGIISVIKGKGGKDRQIPLSKVLVKKLYKYTKAKNKQDIQSVYLFPTIYGNNLKERDMKRLIDKIRYGITFHFTWHQLRHTFATELVRNNFDIYNISQILGHSNINTTKIYLSCDPNKMKKQIDKIDLFA